MANEFHEEIERILKSPYPTQLKHLHAIATRCSTPQLSLWAAQSPCQVDRLASQIVDARYTWPYIYDLIARFSYEQSIRDAFLKHSPQLIYEFLKQETEEAANVLVALLSHPLPQITLPAEAQHFFVKTIDNAARNPCQSTIKTLYTILKGACAGLIGLLSSTQAQLIEQRLLAIVSSTPSAEGDRFGLYAISCMYLVSNQQVDCGPHTYSKLLPYFTGHKAAKTLQLVVLKALWASRHSPEDEGAQLILKLATELVVCLPDDIRQQWCQANLAITSKLEDKVCRAMPASRSQLQAILFIIGLVSPSRPSQQVLSRLTAYVSNADGLLDLCSVCMEAQIAATLPLLDDSAITAMIKSITSLVLAQNAAHAQPASLQGLLAACKHLVMADIISKEAILAALTSESLAALHASSVREQEASDCSASHLTQQGLLQSLCELLLRAAMRSTDRAGLADDLLNMTITTRKQTVCTMHLAQQASIQASALTTLPVDSHASWQGVIQTHLQHKLTTDKQELKHLFRLYCADLEQRCEGVERPLRKEEALNSQLRQELESLRARQNDRILHLERRLEKAKSTNASLTTELEQSREERNAILEKLHTAEQHYDSISREHREHISSLEQQHSTLQLESSMQQARSQARIEDLTDQLSAREQTLERCKQEINRMQDHIEDSEKTIAELRHKLEAARSDHQTVLQELQQKQETVANMTVQHQALQEQLSSTIAAHAEAIAQTKQFAAEEHADQARRMSIELAQQLEQQKSEHIIRMQQMTHDFDSLQAVYSDLEAVRAATDRLIEEQTYKLQRLSNACQKKDAEISDLRGTRDKMLAAMGLKPDPQFDPDATISDIPSQDVPQTRYTAAQHTRQAKSVSSIVNKTAKNLRRATSDNINLPVSRSPLGSLSANTSPSKGAYRRATVHKIAEEDIDLQAFDEDDLLTSTS